MSPFFFDAVVDGLTVSLEAAKEAGLITGLTPNLVDGGLSILQYADDTILLMENTTTNILHIKFLLYCFEQMSGMKINYHKSEVIVLGVEKDEQQRIANLFNCKLGSLPITYLG